MLLGKNPDGSDRVIYVDDPSWVAPAEGETVNEAGWATVAEPVYAPGMSWADISDLEDEYNDAIANRERQIQADKNRFVCPKIPVELEPLMVLPPFKLTPEQIEHKRQEIIANNQGKPGFDPSMVIISDSAYFGVDRAMVTPVDHKFMHNILKCTGVPDCVTASDLKALFTPYASDSRTKQERFIKGRRVEETYPFVNINEDRVAFIIYDAQTTDAQFALHMMKKTIVKTVVKKEMPDNLFGSDKAVKNITLIFGHSCRTGRDIMSDISQQPRPVQRRDNTNPARNNRYPEHRQSDRPNNYQGNTRRPEHRQSDRPDNHNNNRRDDNKRATNNIRRAAAKAIPRPAQSKRNQAQVVTKSNPYAVLENLD
ncbi:Hypothetical protein HVR_LOCUS8 [uncultured virus]|nr:Hypothetical protein HVR_LOCUS8 [uncultured virus]